MTFRMVRCRSVSDGSTECNPTTAKNQTCVRLACRGGGRRRALGTPANNNGVTLGHVGYLNPMSEVAPTNLSVAWSSVAFVRHASLKCSVIEQTSDYSRTHER